MRLVRLLPQRWQNLIHEAAKFGLVGGINLVINYAVFNALALTIFVGGQLKATVVAAFVSTITSYLMNRHWTYRDRPKSALRREYLLFFLFNATGLLIELGVLGLAKYGLGVNSLLALNVAKTGGVALGTMFRFWSYRTFVFRPATAMPDAVAASVEPATTASAVADFDLVNGTEAVTDFEPARRPSVAKADGRLAPLKAEFDDAADVALEAELAVELDAANRRWISR